MSRDNPLPCRELRARRLELLRHLVRFDEFKKNNIFEPLKSLMGLTMIDKVCALEVRSAQIIGDLMKHSGKWEVIKHDQWYQYSSDVFRLTEAIISSLEEEFTLIAEYVVLLPNPDVSSARSALTQRQRAACALMTPDPTEPRVSAAQSAKSPIGPIALPAVPD